MAVRIEEILSAGGGQNAGDIALGSSEGIGNTAVLEYNPQVGNMLQDWSNNVAKRDLFLYNQQQQRIADYMGRIDKINLKELMPSDYNQIHDDYVRLQAEVANNIDVIGNPNSSRSKYADIQSKAADLQRRIAGSQADFAFYKLNKEALDKDAKTFANADNIGYLDDFARTPLGQRQYKAIAPTVNMPWDAIAKRASDIAQQKLAAAQSNGKYLTETESIRYLDEEFLPAARALANEQLYGIPFSQSAIRQFEAMPEAQRRQYGVDDTDGYKRWFDETMLNLKPQDSITKSDIQADQFGLQAQRHRDELSEIAARGAQERANAQFAFNLKGTDVKKAANDINYRTSNLFNQMADLAASSLTRKHNMKLGGTNQSIPVSDVTRYLSEDDRKAMARKRFDDLSEKDVVEYPEQVFYGNVNGVQTLIPIYKRQPMPGQQNYNRGSQFTDANMSRFTPTKLAEGYVQNIYKAADPQKYEGLLETTAKQREQILGTRQFDEANFDNSGRPTTRVFAERTNTNIENPNTPASPSAAPSAPRANTRPKNLGASYKLYNVDGNMYWSDGKKLYDTNGKEVK